MALTLAKVETAIEALLSGGQSYSIDGMSYTQANLQALIGLRDKLKKEEAAKRGPLGSLTIGRFRPPEH